MFDMLKVKMWAAAIVAFFIGVFGIHRAGVKRERERNEARRAAENAEAMGRRVDVVNETQEVRNEVDVATDDELADRLRRWTRDQDR